MDIAVYCGKWILPAKNGTRYLDKIFNPKTQAGLPELLISVLKDIPVENKYVVDSEDIYFLSQTNVTHLFIREPMSQLVSALFTDLWGHLTTKERINGLTTDNSKITDLLTLYTSIGTGHWCCDLYQSIYWLLKKKPDIKVLPLSELTPFMESLGYYEKYDPLDYNFKNLTGEDIALQTLNVNRKDVLKWISKHYPTHTNNIVKLLLVEISYYNKIIKGDFGIELPKIKQLSIKDTKNIPLTTSPKKFL
jgi:hypothetical protein